MRLFAALPLSPAAKDRLAGLRLRLASPSDGLRWSSPEQWHITLRFFGDLEDAEADHIIAAFQELHAPKVSMTLEAFGHFEGKGILFAEAHLPSALTELHDRVKALALQCGLPVDDWPFKPHVTVARSKNRTGLATLKRLSKPVLPPFGAPVHWIANELVLFESSLERQGAIYDPIASITLSEPLQPVNNCPVSQ